MPGRACSPKSGRAVSKQHFIYGLYSCSFPPDILLLRSAQQMSLGHCGMRVHDPFSVPIAVSK